jgi:hypothetical protein
MHWPLLFVLLLDLNDSFRYFTVDTCEQLLTGLQIGDYHDDAEWSFANWVK